MKTSLFSFGALGLGLISSWCEAQQAAPLSIANTSALVNLAPGSSTTIGSVVSGPANSTSIVMVRAVGPTLSSFGIKGAASRPQFQVFDSDGKPSLTAISVIGQIDWNATFASVGAFPLTGGELLNGGVGLFSMPAGAHTVQATDRSGNGGQILVEVYVNAKIVTVPGGPT